MLPIPLIEINAELARALILLLPVIGLGIALWIMPPTYRELVGMLLGILYNIPYILLLNIVAVQQGWWHFAPSPNAFYSVPIELVLGWAFFWGGLLPFAFTHTPKVMPLLLALLIDLLLMPKLPMLFTLGDHWLVGEAALLLVCLLPALIVYHLTATHTVVQGRALLQAIIWGGWTVFLIPAIILTYEGKDIFALYALKGWRFTFFYNGMFLATVIGYAALVGFAKAGDGTPIPFDAPKHLVTTGPYAYVANPLQISAMLMFVALAVALNSTYLLLALVAMLVYSEGFVRWHHESDIKLRFGATWVAYKQQVRNWFPRWRPYAHATSTVYFSQACAICRDMRHSLQRLHPHGLDFTPATLHPTQDLTRITYRHYSGHFEERGVSAVARVFEQVNLSFALLGWVMRLPGINQLLQIIVDGSSEQGEKVIRS